VRLGAQLHEGGALRERDYFRAALPRDVAPGEAVDWLVEVPAPPARGAVLRFDMVDEGITWFAERGSPTLDVPAARDRVSG
jgi:hypothetical protein